MAIKAVIFDCFGVLVASAEVTLYKAFPQYGDRLEELDKQANLGLIDRQHFLDDVSQLTGQSQADLLGHEHHYCNVDDRDRVESAIEWATRIKKSGKYQVAMLSNVGHGWLDNFLAENSIVNLFDTVILSCDVGMIKPDPRIFLLMSQKLGVQPSECVMIDDRAENIAGAKSIGMQGIVFASTAQARAELDIILGQ